MRPAFVVKPVHTLNARGNIMFDVIREEFNLTAAQMFAQIQALRHETEECLQAKKISYKDLRSALVPNQERKDIALFFDTARIDQSWYGLDVMKRVIPLFERETKHSVLLGDYLETPRNHDRMFDVFSKEVVLLKETEYSCAQQ